MREDTLNQERRLNREMRNRIGEVFGELAWECSQLFSETSEQADRRWRLPDILAYERANRNAFESLRPGYESPDGEFARRL